MKIACVGYLHGAGGAERQIIMLSNALSDRGHEVHLIILVENNSKYDISRKVIVHDLSGVEKNKGISILNRFIALKDELKVIRPDISIHYWFQSAYYCAMMNKSIAGKIIYSERGDPSDKEYKGLLGVVRSLAFKRIDEFVFQSIAAQNYFSQEIINRSVVIPNPVFINKFIFSEGHERQKIIISVGRLHEQKNHELLIKAFSLIAEEFPDYNLEIYGEGKLKDRLIDVIKRLELSNRVFLMGTTKEIYEKISSASLFVLSSDYEGMPNVLMEAMALGTPCISTDFKPGAVREIITNHYDGEIVPMGNQNKLAYAMRTLLNNKKTMNLFAKRAIESMKKYHPECIYDKWEKVCSDVVK